MALAPGLAELPSTTRPWEGSARAPRLPEAVVPLEEGYELVEHSLLLGSVLAACGEPGGWRQDAGDGCSGGGDGAGTEGAVDEFACLGVLELLVGDELGELRV